VVQKDVIASNLFLKLHLDQQKMTHYSLKELFASLVALNELQSGGAEATSFERITISIAEWLMDNQAVAWESELMEASKAVHPQMYEY
jgi:hypothetical protein